MPQAPRTRYALSGDAHIAYQVFGEGDLDLVFVPGFVSNIEHYWEMPVVPELFERLGSFARVVIFDKRGTGPVGPGGRAAAAGAADGRHAGGDGRRGRRARGSVRDIGGGPGERAVRGHLPGPNLGPRALRLDAAIPHRLRHLVGGDRRGDGGVHRRGLNRVGRGRAARQVRSQRRRGSGSSRGLGQVPACQREPRDGQGRGRGAVRDRRSRHPFVDPASRP